MVWCLGAKITLPHLNAICFVSTGISTERRRKDNSGSVQHTWRGKDHEKRPLGRPNQR
jgi:hypothetical protein